MKRVNIVKKRILSTILIALIGISAVPADTIFLKDGTNFEGEVEFQNDQFIKVRIKQDDGISQVRILKRDAIEKIVKTAPDDEAFIEVQKMVPTASLLTPGDYQSMLESGPEIFLKIYPDSRHKEEAEKIKEILEVELEKVQLGSVKLGERWFTKEEQNTFDTLYRSEVHLFKMKQLLKRRRYLDLINAMREFELLEKGFFETPAFAKAVSAAQKIAPALAGQLATFRRDVDAKNAQWEERKKALTESQRKLIELEREREDRRLKEAVERDSETRTKWVAVNVRSANDLDKYIKFVTEEVARLELYNPETTLTKANLLAAADRSIAVGELDDAAKKLEEAKAISVWVGEAKKGRTSRNNYSSILASKLKDKLVERKALIKEQEVAEKARIKAEREAAKTKEKKEDKLDALVASRKTDEKNGEKAPKTATKPNAKSKKDKPTNVKKRVVAKEESKLSPTVLIFIGVGVLVVVILILKVLGIGGKREE